MAGLLKDIVIRPPSVSVLSTGNLSRVLVRWELLPTKQDLRQARFHVYRGESPSEMKRLDPNGIVPGTTLEFVDTTANLLDLEKVYYYQVRLVEMEGALEVQTFQSKAVTWDGNPDLVALYVIEEHLFAHRFVYGVPVMIYKKRKEGGVCPDCWDTVLKRVTRSNCTTCYGTGKLGGYYPPIEAWMGFEPDPKAAVVTELGKSQGDATDFQFTNYPLLSVDDIIVEVKPNYFWKIANVRIAEKNRTAMLQVGHVRAVNPTDIEYKIALPEDRRLAMLAELEQREREREF